MAPRHRGETLRQWIERLSKTTNLEQSSLVHLTELHYRYRFDSKANKPLSRETFNQAVDSWLQDHAGIQR